MGDKAIISEILEASHLTDAYQHLTARDLIGELVGAKRKEETGVKYEGLEEEGASSASAEPPKPTDFGAVDTKKEVVGRLSPLGSFQIARDGSDNDEDFPSEDESGLFPLLPLKPATSLSSNDDDDDDQDTFTVDQAVDALGFGMFQVKLSLLTGLAWMADAMEMMILSILSPALHCDWFLSRWQQAIITTVVFCGMMLSSTMWGNICDKYGRRTGLIFSAAMTFFFGALSGLSPTFVWILVLRGLTGFGIGGVPQSVTLYAEFLPSAKRAVCVVCIEAFWAIGACFEVLLALLIMESWGWRWLLIFSSLPLLLFVVCCYWLPESARYHVACGRTDLAYATLKRVAEANGKPMLLGRLVEDRQTEDVKRGRIQDLLSDELRVTTALLWFIWMANAFCYYGVVLFTTQLFESGGECHGGQTGAVQRGEPSCQLECHLLTSSDYVDLLWTTLAEFPGLILTAIVIEWIGRRKTMGMEFCVYAFFVFLLFPCLKRPTVTLFIFVARAFISGAFQAAYVYTPEVYPTTMRAIGLGSCSGFARLGAIVTPFVAQVAADYSVNIPVGVYGVTAVLATFASLMLPIETKGREMRDTHGTPSGLS